MRSTSSGSSPRRSGRCSVDDATLTMRVCALLGLLPGWAWRPDGPAYETTSLLPGNDTLPGEDALPGRPEVGVFYGQIADAPDQAIGVRVYSTTDGDWLHERRVQLMIRGARHRPDGADHLAAPAFAVLHGLARVSGISGIRRTSMAPLGADSNGREERTDNYIITLDNPEAFS
jgi:hypothetical protein